MPDMLPSDCDGPGLPRLLSLVCVGALLTASAGAACSANKRNYDELAPSGSGGGGGSAGDLLTSGGGRTGEGGVDPGADAECTAGARDCVGDIPRECADDGHWREEDPCPEVCDAGACRKRAWSVTAAPWPTPISTRISLACKGSSPYVAFVTDDPARAWGDLHVRRLEDEEWVAVGQPGFAEGLSPSLAFSEGVPHVAFEDKKNDSKVTVVRYDGNAWMNVGPLGFSSDAALEPSLGFAENVPYVAYGDRSGSPYNPKLVVVRYDGTAWVKVGDPDVVTHGHEIEFVGSTPYVGFYGDHSEQGLMSYTGSSWVDVGAGGIDALSAPSVAFQGSTPYVAFTYAGGGGGIIVRMFNGTAWVAVGSEQFSYGVGMDPSIQIADGTPYVAFRDLNHDNKLTVMSFNGSAWVNVGGDAGISEGLADRPQLAICSGTPYVAFATKSADDTDWHLSVMKYD